MSRMTSTGLHQERRPHREHSLWKQGSQAGISLGRCSVPGVRRHCDDGSIEVQPRQNYCHCCQRAGDEYTPPADGNGGGGLKIKEHIKILHQQSLQYTEKLRSEGRKPYFIPPGGSTPIGEWGYIEAFREMMEQGVLDKFDDIVVAFGSSGTACGLGIANYLTGSKVKVHAVSVDHSRPYFYKEMEHHLVEIGLDDVAPSDLVDIIDGYMGGGYGTASQEELAKIVEVFGHTGISLDPDFTLKTLRGMLGEMEGNPGRFAGKRVLFVHTGGIYNLFDKRIDPVLKDSTNVVYSIDDVLS